MTDLTKNSDKEPCDYHYYLVGGPPYPSFVCGLEKGHEGEHKDVTKIILEQFAREI